MSDSHEAPDWLKSIEQNSWQIELLISGGDYQKINYSEEFDELRKTSQSTLGKILWLEKWSSLTYSLAIMLSIICAGAILLVAAFYHYVLKHLISPSLYDS